MGGRSQRPISLTPHIYRNMMIWLSTIRDCTLIDSNNEKLHSGWSMMTGSQLCSPDCPHTVVGLCLKQVKLSASYCCIVWEVYQTGFFFFVFACSCEKLFIFYFSVTGHYLSWMGMSLMLQLKVQLLINLNSREPLKKQLRNMVRLWNWGSYSR